MTLYDSMQKYKVGTSEITIVTPRYRLRYPGDLGRNENVQTKSVFVLIYRTLGH